MKGLREKLCKFCYDQEIKIILPAAGNPGMYRVYSNGKAGVVITASNK